MKTKNSLKGFTLVELIIVMALFSLIMFSVLQLLTPVSKFFVRSANFESSTACLDNMKRAIEGNLKYADRVRCYVNFDPYAENAVAIHSSTDPAEHAPSAQMLEHVQAFYDEFFGRGEKTPEALARSGEAGIRQFVDCRGTIYVLVFDNSSPAVGSYVSTSLNEFNDNLENAGKLVLYEFHFDNTEGEFDASHSTLGTDPLNTYLVQPWYVNQKVYGNFSYQFLLNGPGIFPEPAEPAPGEEPEEPEEPEEGEEETPLPTSFTPSECTVTIRMFEVRKTNNQEIEPSNIALNDSLYLDVHGKNYVSSFSMKNVLNPEGATISNYSSAMNDFKIYEDIDPDHAGYNLARGRDAQQYFQDTQGIPRYRDRVENAGGSFMNNLSGADAPGFYFIFTLPETTSGFTDAEINANPYMQQVNAAYPD